MSLTSSVEHEAHTPTKARTVIATPDLLRITSFVVALSLVVLAAVSVGVVIRHRRSVDAILHQSSTLVVDAQDLYVALAAADAAASTGLLRPGAETPELRASYHENLETAGERLVEIAAGQDVSSSTAASVQTVSTELQTYAGLVEQARANNRQGFPLGTAYLRDASDLMQQTILPAADAVYSDAAHDLDQHYRDGVSRSLQTALLIAAGIALVLLVAAQILVAQRSRRMLNPGLLAATLLVIVLAGASLVLLESQHRSLASSRTDGSEPLIYASASRILLQRSRSDENLYLIERLTESPHADDFDESVEGLGGTGDVIGSIDGIAGSPTAAATGTDRTIPDSYERYLAVHDEIRALTATGSFDSAAELAVDAEAGVATELDDALGSNVEAAESNLHASAEAADDRLTPLLWIALLLPLVAAAAAIAGIEPRVREYR